MPAKKQNVGQENTNDNKEWYIEVKNYGKVPVSKELYISYRNSQSKERMQRVRANACMIINEAGKLIRCPNHGKCHNLGVDENGDQIACPHMNQSNSMLSLDQLYEEYEYEVRDDSEDIVESLVKEEIAEQVNNAISTLDKTDREIVHLLFWEGISEKQGGKCSMTISFSP